MNRAVQICAVLVISVLLLSCAETLQGRLYQAGSASGTAGEEIYKAMYRAHKAGYLTDADMAKADYHYGALKKAHDAYVDAAEKDQITPSVTSALQVAMKAMIDLAAHYGTM